MDSNDVAKEDGKKQDLRDLIESNKSKKIKISENQEKDGSSNKSLNDNRNWRGGNENIREVSGYQNRDGRSSNFHGNNYRGNTYRGNHNQGNYRNNYNQSHSNSSSSDSRNNSYNSHGNHYRRNNFRGNQNQERNYREDYRQHDSNSSYDDKNEKIKYEDFYKVIKDDSQRQKYLEELYLNNIPSKLEFPLHWKEYFRAQLIEKLREFHSSSINHDIQVAPPKMSFNRWLIERHILTDLTKPFFQRNDPLIPEYCEDGKSDSLFREISEDIPTKVYFNFIYLFILLIIEIINKKVNLYPRYYQEARKTLEIYVNACKEKISFIQNHSKSIKLSEEDQQMFKQILEESLKWSYTISDTGIIVSKIKELKEKIGLKLQNSMAPLVTECCQNLAKKSQEYLDFFRKSCEIIENQSISFFFFLFPKKKKIQSLFFRC